MIVCIPALCIPCADPPALRPCVRGRLAALDAQVSHAEAIVTKLERLRGASVKTVLVPPAGAVKPVTSSGRSDDTPSVSTPPVGDVERGGASSGESAAAVPSESEGVVAGDAASASDEPGAGTAVTDAAAKDASADDDDATGEAGDAKPESDSSGGGAEAERAADAAVGAVAAVEVDASPSRPTEVNATAASMSTVTPSQAPTGVDAPAPPSIAASSAVNDSTRKVMELLARRQEADEAEKKRAAANRPPSPIPDAPKGRWRRDQVKPLFASASELRQLVGKRATRCVIVGMESHKGVSFAGVAVRLMARL